MPYVVLSKFGGIAPRFGVEVKLGMAVTALDCDLSARTLAPRKSDSAVSTVLTGGNSLIKWNGAWYSGLNRHYISITIDEIDMLIYLDGDTLKRQTSSATVNLGQSLPTVAPVAASAGTGSLTGTFRYFYTWVREVDGYQDESGPSGPSNEITVSAKNITVTVPTTSDSYVWYCNLYRMSNASAEYQYLDRVANGTTTYTDSTDDEDLGIACPTWYTSNQGNEIIVGPAPTDCAGIASQVYCGMVLAWKNNRLYFCEPGSPDYWPDTYWIDFPSNIVQVVSMAGAIAVLCEDGPYRVDGSHPEFLQQSKPLGKEPCMADTSCIGNDGILYLSDSGIVLFNLVTTTVISLPMFTEDWFAENIDYARDPRIFAFNDKIFLFHTNGALCLDLTTKQWTTLSTVVDAAWVDPTEGNLFYLKDGIVKSLFSGAVSSLTWLSGNIYGRDPFNSNTWLRLFPSGTGTITLSSMVDGLEVSSHSVDLDSDLDRDKEIPLPEYAVGRVLQIQVEGTGTLKYLKVEYA